MSTTISGSDGVSQYQDGSITQADLGVGIASNGPAFSATQFPSQSISSAAWGKINFQVEEFDTANCYNPSLSRFTPNVPGYYMFIASVSIAVTACQMAINIEKNGSYAKSGNNIINAGAVNVSGLIYMNGTTDYVEISAYIGVSQLLGGSSTSFQGYLVRAA